MKIPSFYAVFRYILVLTVAGSLSRYMTRMGTTYSFVNDFEKGYFGLAALAKTKLGVALPAIEITKLLGIEKVAEFERYAMYFLAGLPILALINARKFLLVYFIFFFVVMAVDVPLYIDQMEKYWEKHVDNILMMGLAGYAASL